MVDEKQAERTSIDEFRTRLEDLELESAAIHDELRRRDLLVLAHRTQELVRLTRGILESNLAVLFGSEPARVPQNLKQHVDFADNHVRKALGEEHDYEIITQRLYMATTLAQYVVREVRRAVDEFESGLH